MNPALAEAGVRENEPAIPGSNPGDGIQIFRDSIDTITSSYGDYFRK